MPDKDIHQEIDDLQMRGHVGVNVQGVVTGESINGQYLYIRLETGEDIIVRRDHAKR